MDPLDVLLIDANATFLWSASHFLQDHCADSLIVVGATSCVHDAVELAAALQPHVVLYGLRVMVRPTLEQLRTMRRILPRSGIIALGVLDIEEYQPLIRNAGADDFITKDALHYRLLPTIEQVMRAYR